MSGDPIGQNWSHFQPGDRVSVVEFGNPSYEANVVLTSDLGIVWVLPETGSGRRVFDSREHVLIRHSDSKEAANSVA